jgi:hypothetical protein
LWRRLLAREVAREASALLQCIRFAREHKWLQDESSAPE